MLATKSQAKPGKKKKGKKPAGGTVAAQKNHVQQEAQRKAEEERKRRAEEKAAQKAAQEKAYNEWLEAERAKLAQQQEQARAQQEKLRLEQEAQQRAVAQEKLRLEREEEERQEKLRREQEEKEHEEKARLAHEQAEAARAQQEKLRLEQEAQQRAAAQEKLRLEREEVERQEKLRREQEEKERQEKARKQALERIARGLVETALVQATQAIVQDNRAQQERRQQAERAAAQEKLRLAQEERERQAKITSSQQQAVQHTQQQHKLSPALASKTNAREELLLNKCDSLEDAIAKAIELYTIHKGNPSAQQIKMTTNQVMREWVYEAASRGNTQEVLYCLKNIEPTMSVDAESSLSGYTTPLLEAVKTGKMDLVKLLIDHKAQTKAVVNKPIQFPTGESADETTFVNAALYCLYTTYNDEPLQMARSFGFVSSPSLISNYQSKALKLASNWRLQLAAAQASAMSGPKDDGKDKGDSKRS